MNPCLWTFLKHGLQLLSKFRILEHRHAAGSVQVGLRASTLKRPVPVLETFLALSARTSRLIGNSWPHFNNLIIIISFNCLVWFPAARSSRAADAGSSLVSRRAPVCSGPHYAGCTELVSASAGTYTTSAAGGLFPASLSSCSHLSAGPGCTLPARYGCLCPWFFKYVHAVAPRAPSTCWTEGNRIGHRRQIAGEVLH